MKAAWSIAVLGAVSAAALAPAPASAQEERVRRFVVYGNDPCPRATAADEVIVCARRPNNERYRIPRELRDAGTADDPGSASWASRAEALEYVGRTGIESCSPAGSAGVSGCWNEMVRAWRRDRRQGEGEPGR